MRIGEVARILGTAAPTIRYYEEVGILPAAARRENRYREYRDEDVRRGRPRRVWPRQFVEGPQSAPMALATGRVRASVASFLTRAVGTADAAELPQAHRGTIPPRFGREFALKPVDHVRMACVNRDTTVW